MTLSSPVFLLFSTGIFSQCDTACKGIAHKITLLFPVRRHAESRKEIPK